MDAVASEVVVIGGGPSGLMAARTLQRAGRDVVVVEARDRVGGRTWTDDVGDVRLDLGGQWVGPTQPHLLDLIAEFGLRTEPTPTTGRNTLVLRDHGEDRVLRYGGTIPRLPMLSLVQIQRTMWAVDRSARRIGATAATADEQADDRRSLAEWMAHRGMRQDVEAVLRTAMRVVFGLEAEEVSHLRFLQYVRAAGGVMPLVDTPDGAQDARIVGGAQQVSQRMAAELGDRVVLDSPVAAVDTSDGVVVTTTGGRTFRGEHAVCALPPQLAAELEWRPGLPADRLQWLRGHEMGTTVKTHVLYERPFWTEAGSSGEVVWTDGPLDVAFDNTFAGGPPGLVVFSCGDRGKALGAMDEGRRRATVLAQLVQVFGEAAGTPIAYRDHDWDVEAFTGGCPVASLGPGRGPADFDPARPEGPIHWAGTESSSQWRGYIDGALAAGKRAAAQILD